MIVYLLWRNFYLEEDLKELIGVYSTPELAHEAREEDIRDQFNSGFHLNDWIYTAEKLTVDGKRTFFDD